MGDYIDSRAVIRNLWAGEEDLISISQIRRLNDL